MDCRSQTRQSFRRNQGSHQHASSELRHVLQLSQKYAGKYNHVKRSYYNGCRSLFALIVCGGIAISENIATTINASTRNASRNFYETIVSKRSRPTILHDPICTMSGVPM